MLKREAEDDRHYLARTSASHLIFEAGSIWMDARGSCVCAVLYYIYIYVLCAGINGICVHNIIRMKCADRSTNDEESIDRNERDKHQTSQVVYTDRERDTHMGNGQNVLAKQYRAI